MPKSHDALKAYQRAHRETFPDGLGLRVHRALSWLDKASQTKEDLDAAFLFHWIAFNAAYAQDLSGLKFTGESEKFNSFFAKLKALDTDRELYHVLWGQYTGAIRLLLDNQFVYQPFWDFHNGDDNAADWSARFAQHKKAAHKALGSMETDKLLSIVFSSLYTLRNQLVHGGATWNSSVNRDQVALGVQILSDVVPIIIDLMMRNPNVLWGNACYPVVK